MATDDERGIHPAVLHHIVDLHRKVSELQLQKHDRESGNDEPHEVFQEMLSELKALNANLAKLIPAVKADAKADMAEAHEDDDDDDDEE